MYAPVTMIKKTNATYEGFYYDGTKKGKLSLQEWIGDKGGRTIESSFDGLSEITVVLGMESKKIKAESWAVIDRNNRIFNRSSEVFDNIYIVIDK